MKKLNFKKGFSLVELLVVITIIAILSVVAYTAVGGQTAKAKNSRRMQDLTTIQSALEIYYINNNNKYPATLDALVPKQMPKMALDPASTKTAPLNYAYGVNATSFKEYLLGATLETETTPYYEAYVIGNGTTNLITTGKKISAPTTTCTVQKTDTDCVPYIIP